jgi:hypothetical protein
VTKKLIAAAAMVLGTGGAAFAQQIVGDGYRAASSEPPIDWMVYVYFVVACAGCAVVAFKNAARTHLD